MESTTDELANVCVQLKQEIKDLSNEAKLKRKELKQKELELFQVMGENDISQIITESGIYSITSKLSFS